MRSTLPFQLGELLEVEIEKLSFGGNGIARTESGVVVFVPYSAPGDRLQVKITELKKRHAEAEIVRILRASPERAVPPCPVFGVCGGCNWQHLSYSTQTGHKEKIVREFLQKFANAGTEFLPIAESPKPFHYRNRAQLKYQDGKLGFFKKNSHSVVDTDVCFILEKELSDEIPRLKKELQASTVKNAEIRAVGLALQIDGRVVSDLSPAEADADGFSQVNRFQNALLTQSLLERLQKTNSDADIYDLYAGSGNFTFPIIESFPKNRVLGVELHAGAAKKAQARLKSMGKSPKRAEFYCSDVELFLRRFPVSTNSILVLDPPRVGCSEQVMASIAALAPQKILYISCDPASLARDLDWLWKKSKRPLRLSLVQCFDMFPQTHHVETLVEIEQIHE
jgi:23S rRNA (uracil1939-C5)-methyltransferase